VAYLPRAAGAQQPLEAVQQILVAHGDAVVLELVLGPGAEHQGLDEGIAVRSLVVEAPAGRAGAAAQVVELTAPGQKLALLLRANRP
jgi:hypothetical protein